ncbi:Nascent polypeptide-associated complex subunit beta [Symbiodinium microadriaticum]|uniref:Nascent polypeptide-associated complex subunit beta n=1 Tax=Symbiodinium microadriaticum TaxID=2951 RepID=A0A1Q9CG70_SYMMI|nr:Nascent polypeptide-associated complex subunit beta [Symbiodinium microadriaticum]
MDANFYEHYLGMQQLIVLSGMPYGELLPGVINQIGPDNLMSLKRIAEGFASAAGTDSKKDEDIPDIGENFEEVSKQ